MKKLAKAKLDYNYETQNKDKEIEIIIEEETTDNKLKEEDEINQLKVSNDLLKKLNEELKDEIKLTESSYIKDIKELRTISDELQRELELQKCILYNKVNIDKIKNIKMKCTYDEINMNWIYPKELDDTNFDQINQEL